jgi:hypothetical protein
LNNLYDVDVFINISSPLLIRNSVKNIIFHFYNHKAPKKSIENKESFDSRNESFVFLMNELKDETLLVILVDKNEKMKQNLDFSSEKIHLSKGKNYLD